MRLHAAAAFFAHSLVEADEALSLLKEKRRREQPLSRREQALSERQETSADAEEKPIPRGFFGNRQLKRQLLAQEQSGVGRECDPRTNIDDFHEEDLEADLGFLSCEPDEACVESELSKTGGVCIKMTAQIYRRKMQRRLEPYVCNSDAFPECNCDNFDATTYMGTIVCTYEGDNPEGYCATSGGTEYCYRVSAMINYSGPQHFDSYRVCYEFLTGPMDLICQLLNPYEYSCDLEVNGVPCSLCNITTCPADSGEYMGLIWDCTGTDLDSQGSYCDGDLLLPWQAAEGSQNPRERSYQNTQEQQSTAATSAAAATQPESAPDSVTSNAAGSYFSFILVTLTVTAALWTFA